MKFFKSVALTALCIASVGNSINAGHEHKKDAGMVTRLYNTLTESQWTYYLAGTAALAAAVYFAGHNDTFVHNQLKNVASEGSWLQKDAPKCVAATAALACFCKSTREAEEHGK